MVTLKYLPKMIIYVNAPVSSPVLWKQKSGTWR
jgi:hypothetical protein